MQGKIDAVDGQVKIEFGVSVGATVVVDEVVEKATVLVDGIGVVVVEVVDSVVSEVGTGDLVDVPSEVVDGLAVEVVLAGATVLNVDVGGRLVSVVDGAVGSREVLVEILQLVIVNGLRFVKVVPLEQVPLLI